MPDLRAAWSQSRFGQRSPRAKLHRVVRHARARAARRCADGEPDVVGSRPLCGHQRAPGRARLAEQDGADRVAARRPAEVAEGADQPDGPGGMPGPREQMRRFARIIHVARRKFPCVTHATIQNEPNGRQTDIAIQGVPNLAMRLYEHLYRCLPTRWPSSMIRRVSSPRCGRRSRSSPATSSRKANKDGRLPTTRTRGSATCTPTWTSSARGSRACSTPTRSTSTGSPAPNRPAASSPARRPDRLDNLADLAADLRITKPIYITEYGVRFPVPRESDRPGDFKGVPMERSPESVFEHAWFNARAPQLGFVGLVKWVMYRTDMQTGWGKWGADHLAQGRVQAHTDVPHGQVVQPPRRSGLACRRAPRRRRSPHQPLRRTGGGRGIGRSSSTRETNRAT